MLLRCWHGCGISEVVSALGLELSDLFPPRQDGNHGGRAVVRRRLISAGQALDLLSQEMALAVICASDMAAGKPLDEPTRERLLHSAARITMLRDEVHA